jgi:hypothetical protein
MPATKAGSDIGANNPFHMQVWGGLDCMTFVSNSCGSIAHQLAEDRSEESDHCRDQNGRHGIPREIRTRTPPAPSISTRLLGRSPAPVVPGYVCHNGPRTWSYLAR